MKPTLRRGNETAVLSTRQVDLAQYGYSDAHEPVSGSDIRSAFPVRFDASFLRRDRQYGRAWGQ
jgi:hypothetical protein